MTAHLYAIVCTATVAGWLALYRLPFGDPARRRRIALRLADLTGLAPERAFAAFGSILYLALGGVVLGALAPLAPPAIRQLLGVPSPSAVLVLTLAMAGTSSLNTLCVSLLYRAVPAIDIPGEIARIQWISAILALPMPLRWVVPAVAALVEELVFRGAVFGGITALGGGFAFAAVVSSGLFTLGQIVLVSTRIQVIVLASSSVVLGTVSTLLIAATGSILPAVVLHTSFASFYTNLSANDRPGASTPRRIGR